MNGGKRRDTALVNSTYDYRSPTKPESSRCVRLHSAASNERSQHAGEINSLGGICGPGSVRGRVGSSNQSEHVQKIALAAVRTYVWGVADLDPDCSVVGPMNVKIRKEPRHGKVEIEDESGFVVYPSSNPRFHCNKIQVPMKKIFYTAEDNYDGNDKIELETFSSSGYSRKVFVNVTVKK